MVKHVTEGGLDAWRELYNKYVSLIEDFQNVLIRQLTSIKPVSEANVDSLFDEIERTRELYIKAGSDEEPMGERWRKAAVLQNPSDTVLKSLAIEFKRATSIEEMYSTANTYTFDHKIGLPRGQTSPMLYLAEGPTPESASDIANVNGDRNQDRHTQPSRQEDTRITASANKEEENNQEFYAASNGKGKGKGKVCCECGEQGHFQRECT